MRDSFNVMDTTQPDQNDHVHNQTSESESESQTPQAQSSETVDGSDPQRTEGDRPETSAADNDGQNTSRRSTPQ